MVVCLHVKKKKKKEKPGDMQQCQKVKFLRNPLACTGWINIETWQDVFIESKERNLVGQQ